MDLMVIATVAVLAAIVSSVIAAIAKKSKWEILLSAAIGTIVGLLFGYPIAPFIISFF